MMFVGLQAKLYTLGAAILAFLAFFVRFQAVKNQRDRAVMERDVLKVRHNVIKVQKKIAREEKKRLVSRKADIVKELSKKKEDFKGIDNLSDSNDF